MARPDKDELPYIEEDELVYIHGKLNYPSLTQGDFSPIELKIYTKNPDVDEDNRTDGK